MKFGVIKDGSTYAALQAATGGKLKKVWDRVEPLESTEEGAKKARKGNFAFICEKPFGDYQTMHKPCNLKVIQSFEVHEGPRTYNLAIQKDNPKQADLKDNINKAIKRMVDEGKLQDVEAGDNNEGSLYRKWFKGDVECSSVSVIPSLAVLLSGVLFGVMANMW